MSPPTKSQGFHNSSLHNRCSGLTPIPRPAAPLSSSTSTEMPRTSSTAQAHQPRTLTTRAGRRERDKGDRRDTRPPASLRNSTPTIPSVTIHPVSHHTGANTSDSFCWRSAPTASSAPRTGRTAPHVKAPTGDIRWGLFRAVSQRSAATSSGRPGGRDACPASAEPRRRFRRQVRVDLHGHCDLAGPQDPYGDPGPARACRRRSRREARITEGEHTTTGSARPVGPPAVLLRRHDHPRRHPPARVAKIPPPPTRSTWPRASRARSPASTSSRTMPFCPTRRSA